MHGPASFENLKNSIDLALAAWANMADLRFDKSAQANAAVHRFSTF
jgi:hypothetical protein